MNTMLFILQVVGLDKNLDRMQQYADNVANKHSKTGNFVPLKCDMTNESDILNSFKFIEENIGPVAILVNNAGLISLNSLIDGDTKRWREILDVNILGLCIATREAIKQMKSNNIAGHIIHINSIEGHKVIFTPVTNIYCASKYAVTALTETLRLELNSIHSKIKVTVSYSFQNMKISEL